MNRSSLNQMSNMNLYPGDESVNAPPRKSKRGGGFELENGSLQSNAGISENHRKKSKRSRSKHLNDINELGDADGRKEDTLQSNALVDLDGQEGIYDDLEDTATKLKPRSKKPRSSRLE